ncbi:MAG: rod shape-determining protein RodA [Candidatus Fermentibacteraceae bacterium]|nr:rod shape-determining protein RodA [Candidatus Fermentibacteraceae bacterium]
MRHSEKTDWFFIVALALLLILGLMNVYSASGSQKTLFTHQLFFVLAGVLIFWGASVFPLRLLEEAVPFVYFSSLVLLVLTIFFGSGPAGRWLQIGPLNIQSSEFAKLCVIVLTARWLPALRREYVTGGVSLYLTAVGLLTALTLLQPDLGTASAILMIVFSMIYWAGFGFNWIFLFLSPLSAAVSSVKFVSWLAFTAVLSWVLYRSGAKPRRWVFFLVMTTVLAAFTPAAWNLLRPYQQARLTTFLNPEADPYGAGWNVIQSKVAIGSGRLTGEGFLNGSQNELAFLPARHTDFVFSVWAEEWGFAGSLFLLALYAVLAWRILTGARRSMNPFNSILAAGTAAFILIHVVVNVGMTLGMMPVTGLPLPLVTYGGSHIVTEMLLLGFSYNTIRNWRSY